MKRKTIIITIILLAATAAVAATNIPAQEDTAGETPPGPFVPEIKPVNVRTMRVETSRLNEMVTAQGTTAPTTDVTFSAEVPGKIQFLGVELGERVKKGQVLARIDTRALRARHAQAKSSYELASSTYSRLENLGADLVSRQKLDESRTSLTGAEAQLAIATDTLSKSVLRSSVSGRVSAVHADEAEYVAPGAPILRVVDYSTVLIDANIPETQVAKVTAGSPVTVHIGALEREFEGKVSAVLPTADPVAKTFTARIEVPNPDLEILVGMSAVVQITAEVHEGIVVIPQDLVIEGQDTRSVFVDVDGIAEERAVRLGAVEGDRVVVLEGLEVGEELVTLGHRNLTDGQPIRIAP